MANTLVKTDFNFLGQTGVYHGKVRDVYTIDDDLMVMVATDRISAFDVILPKGIPFKGQVLNQIAATFLDATADIVPNWKLAVPDPMVTVGLKCEGFRVEMIIRGYLTGSAWREYQAGCRELCGVRLPDGMRENQKFPEPIITPTTKAEAGHDENISRDEIIARGIVSKTTMKRWNATRGLCSRVARKWLPARVDTCRHEIRIRETRRESVFDRRNPYARFVPLFLCRWL